MKKSQRFTMKKKGRWMVDSRYGKFVGRQLPGVPSKGVSPCMVLPPVPPIDPPPRKTTLLDIKFKGKHVFTEEGALIEVRLSNGEIKRIVQSGGNGSSSKKWKYEWKSAKRKGG